jgi:hypothetical protein
MLQRLPYLGRVGSGNPNRTFIDKYAKSGLRGISLVNSLYSNDKKLLPARWHHALGDFGARVVAARVSHWSDARKYGKLCASHGHRQVMSDFICAELENGQSTYEFSGFEICDSHIETLDFSNKSIKNLKIINSIIQNLDLEESDFNKCDFKESDFIAVSGVASRTSMPDCFDNSCVYNIFTDIDTSSRIGSLPISDRHKTLIMIIQNCSFRKAEGERKKLYFAVLLHFGTKMQLSK